MKEYAGGLDRMKAEGRIRVVKRRLLYYVEVKMDFGDWITIDSFMTKRSAKKFINKLNDTSSVFRGNRAKIIENIE